MKFDWKPLLAEPAGQTVARGSLLLLKDDSRRGEEIVAMVAEAFGDNRGHYNMVQLSGNESGINPVRVLSHSAFKPGESFSVGWLIRNWNDWVWPGSDVSSAQICYGPVPAGCFKQEESGEPIRGNAMKFDWKPLLAEPAGQTVARGSLLLLQDNSWRDEEVVIMVCEAFGDGQTNRNLVRLSGSKSGINPFQGIPHSAFKPGESFSVGWLLRNWNAWVWLESDAASAQICHGPLPAGCFKQE